MNKLRTLQIILMFVSYLNVVKKPYKFLQKNCKAFLNLKAIQM